MKDLDLTHLLALFIAGALFIMWGTAILNVLFFPRLNRQDQGSEVRKPSLPPGPKESDSRYPLLSILIPARNEAIHIGKTIAAILAQTYPHFELLVLDDHSEDGTGEIIKARAANDRRIKLVNGRSLPPGWLGKNWACHQLSQQANGEYLLFLDADVTLQPRAIAALLAQLHSHPAPDMLTVWPTQTTISWGERLVVPLMALAILAYLPVLPVHRTHSPLFAAANGQCLLFRRSAYTAIGGHTAVSDHIVEDVALARLIKNHGLNLRMADGNGLIGCRMYQNWGEVTGGYAKNILAGHGNSILFLGVSTLFHWLIFIWPWLWVLTGGGVAAVGLGLAGIGLRAVTAVFSRQRWLDALLMPISVGLMTRIAAQSVWWRWRGGGQWKGRTV